MYLIIAEKAIAAKRIASILSNDEFVKKKDSLHNVEYYHFSYKNYKDTIVIGLSGHVVGIDFNEKYNNWKNYSSEDLINAEINQVATNKNIINLLKQLSMSLNYVTIATDYDREGELIGVEALQIILKNNSKIKYDRALYSAITKKDICTAFSNLTNINFNLADSGYTREVIDLIWGAVLTRYISLVSGRLGNMFLSVGRVQSPTLALIVNKEKEINSFISSIYYEIEAKVSLNVKNKKQFIFYYKPKRISSFEKANNIYSSINHEKSGIISQIINKKREDKVPIPLNTTGFYVAATSIGFTINNAKKIYQKLYELGYLSYPRTDSTIYPKNFDFKSILEMFINTEFNEEVKKLLKLNKLVPSFGKKKDLAHPPIHPVSYVSKDKLNEEEWKIYELVVRHFLSIFSSNAVWENIKIELKINEHYFYLSSSKLIDFGWRYFYNYNIPEHITLPKLKKGDQLKISKVELLEKKTKQPLRYGQGKLIKMMDNLGLGTKATRVDIINKLMARYYIVGNPYKPTKIANAVIDTLASYSPLIVNPDMTKKLEEDMDKIAIGELKSFDVIESSKSLLKDIILELDKNKNSVSLCLKKGLLEDKIIGKCHICKSNLTIKKSKKGLRFIGCEGYPNCSFSLPLPKNGKILITDNFCGLHSIYLIKIIVDSNRIWNLGCPYCNFLNWDKNKKL